LKYNGLKESGFEMRRWRRMEKISRTDRVRKGKLLQRNKEEANIQYTVKGK